MKRVLTAAVPALIILLADQWLKAVSAWQNRVLIPGVLSLSYTLNTGFALGPQILGDIKIADNVRIGAGAVVVKDITTPGVTVTGVPAKEVSSK